MKLSIKLALALFTFCALLFTPQAVWGLSSENFKLEGGILLFGGSASSDEFEIVSGAGGAVDFSPPLIFDVRPEVASTGGLDQVRIQAIISWRTNEPATSLVEYGEGIGAVVGFLYPSKTSENKTYSTSHAVVVPNLQPGRAYHFRAISSDRSGNQATSDDFTLVTPVGDKTALQVVVSSWEETYYWLPAEDLFKVVERLLGLFL